MITPFVTSLLESCRDGEIAETLNAWFTPDERAALASAALKTLDDDMAKAVVLHGAPRPVFTDVRAEARLWASWASLPECRAYIAAIWNHLPDGDRADFINTVSRRAA